MNSESPFRISRMFLTVACIVCGVTAGITLVPRLMYRSKLIDQTTAAGALQLNLAEFHAIQQDGSVENRPTTLAHPRTLFPLSTDVPSVHTQNPAVKTTVRPRTSASQSGVSDQTASTSDVTSVTADRNVSHWASIGNTVPQFYAPVTVHPVTVNVDNSGLIREISRVHERLDSLTGVKPQPEMNVTGMSNADQSRVTTKKVQSEPVIEPPPSRIDYIVHDVDTMRPSPKDAADVAQMQTANAETKKIAESKKPDESGRIEEPARIVERLPVLDKIKSMPIPLSVPVPKTPQVPAIETKPESESAAAESESVLSLEFNFEVVPSQQEPASRAFQPSAFIPQIEEAVTTESNGFSTELYPIPIQDSINESIPSLPPIQLIPRASPFSQSRTEAPRKTIRPSQVPELIVLSRPDQGSSKRTTDPPFMNGRAPRDSNVRTQNANKRTLQIQRVSSTVESSPAAVTPQPSSTPSRTVSASSGWGKRGGGPTSMLQAIAPSEMLRHIRTLFQK